MGFPAESARKSAWQFLQCKVPRLDTLAGLRQRLVCQLRNGWRKWRSTRSRKEMRGPVNITKAFATFSVKRRDPVKSYSAIMPDGSAVVVSLWRPLLKNHPSVSDGLRYQDRFSRWTSNGFGKREFQENIPRLGR